MYDEYGEVIVEDDGYYYGQPGSEVMSFHEYEFHIRCENGKDVKQQMSSVLLKTFQRCCFIITKGC